MTNTTTADKKAPTRDHTRQRTHTPPRSAMIGIDTDGREHYYVRALTRVQVFDGDEMVYEWETVDDLEEWRDYVAGKCGWETWNVTQGRSGLVGMVERMAASIELEEGEA